MSSKPCRKRKERDDSSADATNNPKKAKLSTANAGGTVDDSSSREAPRRASNAYMVFCKERRAELVEDRPDLTFGELGAKLGEIWRGMAPEEKRPFEERAQLDRDRCNPRHRTLLSCCAVGRYEKEMSQFRATRHKKAVRLTKQTFSWLVCIRDMLAALRSRRRLMPRPRTSRWIRWRATRRCRSWPSWRRRILCR